MDFCVASKFWLLNYPMSLFKSRKKRGTKRKRITKDDSDEEEAVSALQVIQEVKYLREKNKRKGGLNLEDAFVTKTGEKDSKVGFFLE
jgi:hypothetical protein